MLKFKIKSFKIHFKFKIYNLKFAFLLSCHIFYIM